MIIEETIEAQLSVADPFFFFFFEFFLNDQINSFDLVSFSSPGNLFG